MKYKSKIDEKIKKNFNSLTISKLTISKKKIN